MPPLFNLPPRSNKGEDIKLAKKSKSKSSKSSGVAIKGSGGLMQRINEITAAVNKYLGHLKLVTVCIREEKEFIEYIDNCIKAGEVGFDTEANSEDAFSGEFPDPMCCTMAGFSLYYPGGKAAYIPMHHVSYITGIEVENQLTEDFIKEQMQRLIDSGAKFYHFNSTFDCRMSKHQLKGLIVPIWWDAYVGARLLNENEGDGNNGLKALHTKYVMKGEGEKYSFSSLFKGIPFSRIPIKVADVYAAIDAKKHYELGKFQEPYLTPGTPECTAQELEGVAYVYREIEIPVIQVTMDMEDVGIALDYERTKELSEKYQIMLTERNNKFYELCDMYKEEIQIFKNKNASHGLSDPINMNSPKQVAVLMYDIIKEKVVDKKSPRGTGEEILSVMDNPLAKAILECRNVSKLLNTYIEKMPTVVSNKDGRIHCKFNQNGTVTGRYSSQDPNMQNIPSKNDEIRTMFSATEGYVWLSSDYSAQEPRITSHMSNDEKMIQAYRDGKDVYVEIASLAFDLAYDECKEFRADGTHNPEGKSRRNQAKAIVLGICYGKGIPAIATDLGVPVKKAQEIYDKVLASFPGLKNFMEESENMARTKGYVTTIWGRKRRLPDMQLPLYEFSYAEGYTSSEFDPLNFEGDEELDYDEVDSKKVEMYTRLLNNCRKWNDKIKIIEKAKGEGIIIKDNGSKIAEATRQCVNSRVQGSAADQTKIAMILVHNDQQLRDWGFRLILPVHDELIGECPKENAKKVAKRFSDLMVEAAKDLKVPSKCDVEITNCWYGEPIDV